MADQGISIADIQRARNQKQGLEAGLRQNTDKVAAELQAAHADAERLKDSFADQDRVQQTQVICFRVIQQCRLLLKCADLAATLTCTSGPCPMWPLSHWTVLVGRQLCKHKLSTAEYAGMWIFEELCAYMNAYHGTMCYPHHRVSVCQRARSSSWPQLEQQWWAGSLY